MLEKSIEDRLRRDVKALGGQAYKFVSPGNAGVPDRIVLLPNGIVIFVELKALGKTPTKMQLNQHAALRALGFRVEVLSGIAQVKAFIHTLREGGKS